MKDIIVFLLISLFAFTACKKKDKTVTPPPDCSLSEANVVGSYKITAVKYKASASAPEQDFIDQYLDPCQKDDVTTFKADHTFTYTDAGTACSPSGDDSGTWALTGNAASIDGHTGIIEDFSCKGFNVIASDAVIAGDKITITYVKQ